MLTNTNLSCCNFSFFPLHLHNHHSYNHITPPKIIPSKQPFGKIKQQNFPFFKLSALISHKNCSTWATTTSSSRRRKSAGENGIINGGIKLFLSLQKWRKWEKGYSPLQKLFCSYSSLKTEQNPENPFSENEEISLEEENIEGNGNGGGGGGGGGEERDWTTSFLLFGLYAGLIYYLVFLAPNQTPSTDMYFLKKLLNLIGDDGFQVNRVLVALWYIMGLYPFVYSMLLLPTGRSEKSSVPVWPFLILSGFLGAYSLIPYFILWRPPPPPIGEAELRRWPLNFLESKFTAGIILAAGLGLMTYAGLSNAAGWKEFYLYFRSSRFIHITCIDFALLSTFAPFWVYNDMAARRWDKNVAWLLPLSLIPFLGPALYLILRPSLSAVPNLLSPSDSDEK